MFVRCNYDVLRATARLTFLDTARSEPRVDVTHYVYTSYVLRPSARRRSHDLHALRAVLPVHLARLLAARPLGDQPSLGAVGVPQSAQRLPGDHLPQVHADQPQYEHAVAAQVPLGELGEHARLALSRVEGAQLLAHVVHLPGPVERADEPLQQVRDADEREEDEPEPDEDEDLLVEQVDRQHALHHVAVHARLVADLEVAERDAREALRRRPVLTADQPLHDVRPVQVVLHPEERVEQEQLADGVDDVDDLDDEVGGRQVVAVETTADEAAAARDQVLDADAAAGAVVALREQVTVHLVDDVADRLLADLQVGRLRAHVRGVHDGGQVDAGPLVEEAPNDARHERHRRLEHQDERHPLVVADHLVVPVDEHRVLRDRLLHRQVVGVAHPADGVRVVAVAGGKLRRTPAADRLPDELLRADEEREADEDHDRKLVRQPVNVVVVRPQLDLTDTEDRLEETIHGG